MEAVKGLRTPLFASQKERQMKHLTILTAVILMICGGSAVADDRAERWAKRGVGAGAATGALVGGPPGALFGAVVGGFVAHRTARAHTAVHLETDLAQTRSDLDGLRDSLDSVREELVAARMDLSDREQRIAELEQARRVTVGLETEVLFRTGSSGLEPVTDGRLDRLADMLQQNEDLSVRLDGYADPRGESGFNMDLSRDRAQSVRDGLVARGIRPERIESYAHGDGDAVAEEGDLDAYAMERRVRIRLESDDPDGKVAHRE